MGSRRAEVMKLVMQVQPCVKTEGDGWKENQEMLTGMGKIAGRRTYCGIIYMINLYYLASYKWVSKRED